MKSGSLLGRQARLPSHLSQITCCARAEKASSFRCQVGRKGSVPPELLELPVTDLQSSLDEAVVAEEYEKAAILRDAINAKKEGDRLLVLERELREAVEEEAYEEAARCRDAIADEIASRPLPVPVESSSGTRSSATTEGVRVDVQSIFVPQVCLVWPSPALWVVRPACLTRAPRSLVLQHSGVQGNMFAYQISITNVAHPTKIKLISRHWEIKDGQGRERIVDGEGVVGEQPELAPGETFTYSSSCPLQTESGRMKGHFEFYSRASTSTSWNTSFLVYVAEFLLDVSAPRAFTDEEG